MPTPRFLICLFFLSQGGFSFSQSPYELFTINTDSFINIRFNRLEDKIHSSIYNGSLTLYKEDLASVIKPEEIKAYLGIDPKPQDRMKMYGLRIHGAEQYISAIRKGKPNAWFSLEKLRTVLKDTAEYNYMADLFLKKRTRANTWSDIRIDSNEDMEDSFHSFHDFIRTQLLNGSYTAYADAEFQFELYVSQIRSRDARIIYQLSPNPNTGSVDTVAVPVIKVPTHYRYLHDYAFLNGKIIKDQDFPIALAPVIIGKDATTLMNCDSCIDVLFWVRTDQMNLMQWQKNMIRDWEHGRTDNYVIDRYSVALYEYTSDPERETFRKAVETVVNNLKAGQLTPYRDRAFMFEQTVSQFQSQLHYADSIVGLSGTKMEIDRIGLSWYWYREHDSIPSFLSNLVGITMASSNYRNGIPLVYIFAPEAFGIKDSVMFKQLVSLLKGKLKARSGQFRLINVGVNKSAPVYPLYHEVDIKINDTLVSGNIKLAPQNLLDGFYSRDSMYISYVPSVVYSDARKENLPVSCYLTRISDRKLENVKQNDGILIPAGIQGAMNQAFRPCLLCKAGYMDRSGRIVVPLQYNLTLPMSEGMGAVANYYWDAPQKQFTPKFGFIDKFGKLVIPMSYEGSSLFSYQMAAVKKDGKWGYIDSNGKEKIAFQYDFAGDFSDDVAIVRLDGKYRLINRKGKPVGKAAFDTISPFVQDVALVRLGSRWGAIDKKGRVILDTVHERISAPRGGRILAIDYSGENYIYSTSGKQVAVVPGIGVIGVHGNVLVQKQDSQGTWRYNLLDYESKKIISVNYDEVGEFTEGMLPVKKKGLWGYLDSTGKEVIACQYEKVFPFSEGVAIVERNIREYRMTFSNVGYTVRRFFIDKNGKSVRSLSAENILIHPPYKVEGFKQGLMRVRFNNAYRQEGYISRDGREYIYH